MRGAHLSDLHLGFRAFTATCEGRNHREVDVERAWFAAVEQVIDARPDLVTVAGDIVHHPRVSDFAKRALLQGLRHLLEETEAHVVLLAGNHDAPRTADTLNPIRLADVLAALTETEGAKRLHVVTEPKRLRIRLAGELVSVACYPFVDRGDGTVYTLEPDAEADVNVLVIHAAVRGHAEGNILPTFYAGAEAIDVGREADRWDVIHCGDYHEFTRLHPERLAFYSGALERTSSNIWQETAPKGWVLTDTAAGTLELREVETREMADYDLPDFYMEPGAGATDVNEALEALAAMPSTEGSIVRFKVDAFPREEREQIDWALVRELKHRCLHFQLDLRLKARESTTLPDRRDNPTASLAEEVAAFFRLDEEQVRRIVLRYLELEREAEGLPPVDEPELELQEATA